MIATVNALVGRLSERAVIHDFLDGAAERPRALIFEGDVGIGKSTVWEVGVRLATERGIRVLRARSAQSEANLSFSGLTDLFDPIDEQLFSTLPAAMRIALDVAMLRRPPSDSPIGQREVSAAALSLLRILAADRRLIVAIDDLQWLDKASAEALAFALRRLWDRPVGLLASRRTRVGPPEPANHTDQLINALPPVRNVVLGPLDEADIASLLADRLQLRLPTRSLRRVIGRTGGNPLWTLEVGREISMAGDQAELPLPEGLSSLIGRRLRDLDADAHAALLVVAALAYPSFELCVRALTGVVADPELAIDAAALAGVIAGSGPRLRPAHPMLGSVALERLTPAARSELHSRLAGTVGDPEQHARHLAAASPGGKDSRVAAALDQSAAAARDRGAISAAAELIELAVQFCPAEPARHELRLHIHAAEIHEALGDLELAYHHANIAYAGDLTVEQRRQILPYLFETFWVHGTAGAHELIRSTLDAPDSDPYLRAIALAYAAENGDGLGTPRLQLAQEAQKYFEESAVDSDPAVAAYVLVILADIHIKAGNGLREDYLERAERAQRQLPAIPFTQRASTIRAFFRKAVDDLDGARVDLQEALAAARGDGEDGALPLLLGHLTLTECWAGRYADAAAAAEEGLRLAGPRSPLMVSLYGATGLLRVMTGDMAGARALMAEQPTNIDEVNPFYAIIHNHVLGLAALLSDDDDTAVVLLRSALNHARQLEIHEPGRRYRLESDLGQALINTGNFAEAAVLAAELRELGDRQQRPTITGVGLRIEGLMHAAQGDVAAAEPLLEAAVEAHENSPFRLERGLSLFALGRAQRRRKARSRARTTLGRAETAFTEIGAAPYAAFVRMILAEIGAGSLLTDSERRVADLLVTGMSNREIAATLFASVRTVEGHLSAIYHKLGIHSRTELIRRLPELK